MYIHREAQRGRAWIEQASWEPFFGLLELFRCLLGASRPTIFYMLPIDDDDDDDDDDVIELPVRASSQRGPEKPREPQRGTERPREAQRGRACIEQA